MQEITNSICGRICQKLALCDVEIARTPDAPVSQFGHEARSNEIVLTTMLTIWVYFTIIIIYFIYLFGYLYFFQEDKGFDKSLFEKQMSVMRGQVRLVLLFNKKKWE